MNAPSWLPCKPRSSVLPVQLSLSNPAFRPRIQAPYFLDFLDLRQGHDEADLEATILRQIEAFILELGLGFALVERQKRMVMAYPAPTVNIKNGITEVKFATGF